ncbi:MAG: gliding motility lipoprotein GldH [Saprospiraceae bacterium]|nr:gliding motility lipoprotein GldH [Saprospiraceae bacterium]
MKSILSLLGIALTVLSCNSDVLYEQEERPGNPWKSDQILTYKYEVTDTIHPYDIVLKVHHSDTFAYENLYVKIATFFPKGDSIVSPLSLELADDQGNWQGKCKSGNCETTIVMSQAAYYPQTGIYKLQLEQFSREDELPGIESIQIIVRKHTGK